MLTAATETNLGEYIVQLGSGPGLGIFQMEPATFEDIKVNYLAYHPELRNRIREILGDLDIDELENDIRAQIIFARLLYYRVPKPIPNKNDIPGLANYYKLYFNTVKGAAVVADVVKKYKKYVEREA
jgi:hypothetical protein